MPAPLVSSMAAQFFNSPRYQSFGPDPGQFPNAKADSAGNYWDPSPIMGNATKMQQFGTALGGAYSPGKVGATMIPPSSFSSFATPTQQDNFYGDYFGPNRGFGVAGHNSGLGDRNEYLYEAFGASPGSVGPFYSR